MLLGLLFVPRHGTTPRFRFRYSPRFRIFAVLKHVSTTLYFDIQIVFDIIRLIKICVFIRRHVDQKNLCTTEKQYSALPYVVAF